MPFLLCFAGPDGKTLSTICSLEARVAELADALDLGSSGSHHGGSSPPSRTSVVRRETRKGMLCGDRVDAKPQRQLRITALWL